MTIKKNTISRKEKLVFNIRSLENTYIQEHILDVYQKAYSILLFSEHYVFKIFFAESGIYDLAAVESEYEWDCTMPFLCPKIYTNVEIEGKSGSVLVMKKLPQTSNILYMVLNGKVTVEKLGRLGRQISDFFHDYKCCKVSAQALYRSYIENVQQQLSELRGDIANNYIYRIEKIIKSDVVRNLFCINGKRNTAKMVHGNMFLGNIFYYLDKTIVIDPISINHVARVSYEEMDLAAYLIDLKILLKREDYQRVFESVTKDMEDYRILMLKLYSLLKLLVRIRFSSIEMIMKSNVCEKTMNIRVQKNKDDVIMDTVGELECWVK